MKVCKTLKTYFHTPKSLINQGKHPLVRKYESFFKSIIGKNIYVYNICVYNICVYVYFYIYIRVGKTFIHSYTL